jgi:hypothetical protein
MEWIEPSGMPGLCFIDVCGKSQAPRSEIRLFYSAVYFFCHKFSNDFVIRAQYNLTKYAMQSFFKFFLTFAMQILDYLRRLFKTFSKISANPTSLVWAWVVLEITEGANHH